MLIFNCRRGPGGNGLLPPAQVRLVAKAPPLHVRGGGRSKPDITFTAPIPKIVKRFTAWPRVIAHLVSRQPRIRQPPARLPEHRHLHPLLRRDDPPEPAAHR